MKDLTKILCSYLPYDLMCIAPHKHGVIKNPRILTTKNIDFADRWKPILRPLSQLTEKIKEGGKEFVPIARLFEVCVGINYFDADVYDIFEIRESKPGWFICYELNRGICLTIDGNDDCNIRIFDDDQSLREIKRQMFAFKLLHEWHFDLYGLIESGQAISIEDLQYNPYE